MITREQALTFILQNQRRAEMAFLDHAREVFRRNNGVIPPSVRAKFLAAGGSYGEFRLNQDWTNEMEQEVWDGVLYAGLAQLKKEMLGPTPDRDGNPE